MLMRYLFDASEIWIMELETYFFAIIFLLGGSYASLFDQHVRVDLWYDRMSDKHKAITDIIGGLVLLMPWAIILMLVSFEYAHTSYRIGEKSAQPGGLPYSFILKSMISIGFFFVSLQGISQMLKAIQYLIGFSENYDVQQRLSSQTFNK